MEFALHLYSGLLQAGASFFHSQMTNQLGLVHLCSKIESTWIIGKLEECKHAETLELLQGHDFEHIKF